MDKNTNMTYNGIEPAEVDIQGAGITINGDAVDRGIHTLVHGDIVRVDSLDAEPLTINGK